VARPGIFLGLKVKLNGLSYCQTGLEFDSFIDPDLDSGGPSAPSAWEEISTILASGFGICDLVF
jgi:hypothetical protein